MTTNTIPTRPEVYGTNCANEEDAETVINAKTKLIAMSQCLVRERCQNF